MAKPPQVSASEPYLKRKAGGIVSFLVLILVASLPVGFGSSAVPVGLSGPVPLHWTNGLVLCNFARAEPTVAVSLLNQPKSGLNASLATLEEFAPGVGAGSGVVAVASSNKGNWTWSNLSDPEAFGILYVAHLPEHPTTNPSTTSGIVRTSVEYSLPAYHDHGLAANVVTMNVSITGWNWVGTGDELTFHLPVWLPFLGAERLVTSAGGSVGISTVSNSTGSTLETIVPGTSALIFGMNGISSSVPVSAQVSVSSVQAEMILALNRSAGEFRSANLTIAIGVLLPPALAILPWYDYALVGGAGGGLILGLVATYRRVRARPSELFYAEAAG
jgi:hypothetical protein